MKLAWVLAAAAAVMQQAPQATLSTAPGGNSLPIRNAKLETRSAAAGLEATMNSLLQTASPGPIWVGYRVPSVPGRRQTCSDGDYASTVHLEGPSEYYILYRLSDQRIQHVRVFSPDCVLDAGNVPFYWLTDVKAGESVAWLEALIPRQGSALGALAIHAAPEAVRTLERLARGAEKPRLRGQATVWLARTAPFSTALPFIREGLVSRESELKREAVVALYEAPGGEGIPMLIQLARDPKDRAVQKHAMFWLGRSKDPRATAFFEEVLGR
jgi:hypothetical protein